MAYLDYVKPHLKIVFIYLQEAHADDLWPLGYGIKSSKTVEERWNNCDNLMKKWPDLATKIDKIFIDNMDEQFNKLTGAWPECYFFADSAGKCLWKSNMGDVIEQFQVFNEAFKFGYYNGFVKLKDEPKDR